MQQSSDGVDPSILQAPPPPPITGKRTAQEKVANGNSITFYLFIFV